PGDDLLSALAGTDLTPDECTEFADLLVSAGTETVARLLGWAGVVLAEHPAQRAQLAADRALIPGAVEELLRLEPTSPVQGRWAPRSAARQRGMKACFTISCSAASGSRWTPGSSETTAGSSAWYADTNPLKRRARTTGSPPRNTPAAWPRLKSAAWSRIASSY